MADWRSAALPGSGAAAVAGNVLGLVIGSEDVCLSPYRPSFCVTRAPPFTCDALFVVSCFFADAAALDVPFFAWPMVSPGLLRM